LLAGGLALADMVHFSSIALIRCLNLCKVVWLVRDCPSIMVMWACK